MIVVDNNPTFREELMSEISRIALYLDSLERLAVGAYPKWDDWGSGQRLLGAERVQRPVTALQGRLADGRQVVTKPIQILAVDQKWARTTDGLYRLVTESD